MENSDKQKSKNSRSFEREQENRQYTPVIIKRFDESKRHPDDILEVAIEEGKEQHTRTTISLFLSAVAAGMILGFAAMVVAIAAQFSFDDASKISGRLIIALFYPLGFIICISSGTQLFTEQTATAIYPVLDNLSKVKSLLRVWLTVLVGNLFGAVLSAALITSTDQVISAGEGYVILADHILNPSTFDLLLSSILAGWLMAQGGWLILATPFGSSQILCIYIVTFIIGFGGLHHSIAGAAEIFSYLFMTDLARLPEALIFILTAAFGNLIGGSLFVGVLNYGHIRQTA